MDSGISELPSSTHSSPSPILPHSPTGQRPSSGDRRRTRPVSKTSYSQFTRRPPDGRPISNSPTESRPSSAFSNYNPLPEIGRQETDSRPNSGNHEYQLQQELRETSSGRPRSNSGASDTSNTHSIIPRPPSGNRVSTRELRRQQFSRRRSSQTNTGATPHSQIKAGTTIPNEPLEDEPRILLAIKLPNGQRLQRYFRPSDRFTDISTYAETESNQSFCNCNLFINQVPKRLVSNWKETFHEAGLLDRTLLCLEEKDD